MTPDLAADGSSSYIIDISKWATFNKSKRHLTLCLVTLHQAVREHGDVNQNQALFHYHQACAAEVLNHRIKTLGQVGPNPELFEDVSLFFFSQIQASAYGAWRAHLNAGKALFNAWGVDALMGKSEYEFHLFHLVIADVFGMATAPALHISAEDAAQHKVYLALLGRLNVDVCGTMVPIPEVVVRATTSINIVRAAKATQGVHTTEQGPDCEPSTLDILESLQAFDPTNWASHLPSRTSSHAMSWALLATCYQTAAILYLARTCGTSLEANIEEPRDDYETSSYSRLSSSIRELYDLRQCGGVLYKYILWPMVICGVETVARKDEQQLRLLCKSLEWTTVSLGTLSMREAAVFLDELWKSHNERSDRSSEKVVIDWDAIFHNAPLFLM
jgi:hypothetical protein